MPIPHRQHTVGPLAASEIALPRLPAMIVVLIMLPIIKAVTVGCDASTCVTALSVPEGA
jgi:hypothetical protein